MSTTIKPYQYRDPLSRRLFRAGMALDQPHAAAREALREEQARLEAEMRRRLAPLEAAARSLREEKERLEARKNEVERGIPLTWQQVRAPLIKAGLRQADKDLGYRFEEAKQAPANGAIRAKHGYDHLTIRVEVYGDAAGRLAAVETVKATLEPQGYTLTVQATGNGVPYEVEVRRYGPPLTEEEVAAVEALATEARAAMPAATTT